MEHGIVKPKLQALVQVKDRMTFLYIEHAVVNRQDGAITVTDARGTVHVPAAALNVLLIGPGTNLTHRAVELIGDSGMTLIWVGEQGVRYYAHERSFVYDIADLYKAEMTIPLAFQAAAEKPKDIASEVRRRVRDAASDGHILERIVRDIRRLLAENEADEVNFGADVIYLWDDKRGRVLSGVSYNTHDKLADVKLIES